MTNQSLFFPETAIRNGKRLATANEPIDDSSREIMYPRCPEGVPNDLQFYTILTTKARSTRNKVPLGLSSRGRHILRIERGAWSFGNAIVCASR